MIFLGGVKFQILICYSRGRDLSEKVHKSIWCELKSPPKTPEKGGTFQGLRQELFYIVKTYMSRHVWSQNDRQGQG